jgi:predicted translin family RNA/ssDNA-binding protein
MFMTKLQANELHQLRRDLIKLSQDVWQARHKGDEALEKKALRERKKKVKQIENVKRGNSR